MPPMNLDFGYICLAGIPQKWFVLVLMSPQEAPSVAIPQDWGYSFWASAEGTWGGGRVAGSLAASIQRRSYEESVSIFSQWAVLKDTENSLWWMLIQWYSPVWVISAPRMLFTWQTVRLCDCLHSLILAYWNQKCHPTLLIFLPCFCM